MSAPLPTTTTQAPRGTRKPRHDSCGSLAIHGFSQQKRAALRRCPHDAWLFLRSGRRRRFGLRLRLLLHRPGVLTLPLDVAIDKLDHRDRRGIAVAEPRLEPSGIASVAILVARTQHLEQLL